MTAMRSDSPFASFWQAGYEGADHINHNGQALDMNAVTGHIERDYSHPCIIVWVAFNESWGVPNPVSYTHLTLPTILLV